MDLFIEGRERNRSLVSLEETVYYLALVDFEVKLASASCVYFDGYDVIGENRITWYIFSPVNSMKSFLCTNSIEHGVQRSMHGYLYLPSN